MSYQQTIGSTNTKPKFDFKILKEINLYQDDWKRLTIAHTITKWESDKGAGEKPNITLTRYYPDAQTGVPKVGGRVQFPINVWDTLIQNIQSLTLEVTTDEGLWHDS